jgi:16S rRNA (cytidine1402-2'-O)-methyltransferase
MHQDFEQALRQGMLYLVATPIGNLSDITLRAIETLKSCDYILCEDTRRSLILLNHYEIRKPLRSYHKFNEASSQEKILLDLQSGKNICLISDAGTPGISDPGTLLIKHCVEKGVPVVAIPGPCAAIQAMVCSGLPTDRFQFWGFLPKKDSDLKKALREILSFPAPTICYESPHRLLKVLTLIQDMEPERTLVVARELTKKFEEFFRGTASHQLAHWNENTLKGEICLLVDSSKTSSKEEWAKFTPEEHVQWLQEHYSITKKEAIKLAAEMRGIPKRTLYTQINCS